MMERTAFILCLCALGLGLADVKDVGQNVAASERRRVDMNDIKEAVRQELNHSLSRKVDSYLQTLATRQDSQNHLALVQDLRELVQYHEGRHSGVMHTNIKGPAGSLSLRLLHEKVDNISTLLEGGVRTVNRHSFHDCSAVMNSGQTTSGVYNIRPPGGGPIRVYCDMETNGGGWTVIQRRLDGGVNFFRSWMEYARGFGAADGEYWLGNRALYLLTHNHVTDLYVHLADLVGNSRHATYSNFAVSSEFSHFRLDIGSFTGNAGDGLTNSIGHKFSTKDKDNDGHPDDHCSNKYGGGWWYNACYHANLNGQYLNGSHRGHKGINWTPWLGDSYSLKRTVMMIRPTGFTTD